MGPGRERFPETAGMPGSDAPLHTPSAVRRAGSIWQEEGPAALLHRFGKEVQWKLQMDV
jgi:hypothetical protein